MPFLTNKKEYIMNDKEDSATICTICGGTAHEVYDEKTQWLECGNNENHFATFWTHEWIDAS